MRKLNKFVSSLGEAGRTLYKRYGYLAQNSVWLVGLNTVRQALGIVVVMVLVRVLTKEQFGQYQFVIATVALCGVFTLFEMRTAIVQSVARGHPGIFRWVVRAALIGASGGAVMVAIVGLQQREADNIDVFYAFMAAALFFPLAHGMNHWPSWQAGNQQFRLTALSQGGAAVFSQGAILLCALTLPPKIWIYVLVSQLVLAALNVFLTRRSLSAVPKDSQPEPGSIRYGLRIWFYGVFNLAGNHADKLLLFYFLSPEALAIYVAASRIPELLKDNLQALRLVLIPRLSRKGEYSRRLDRKLNILGVANVALLIVIGVGVVPWFVPLIFSDKYADSVFYCQLLLISNAFGMVATIKYSYIASRLDHQSARGVTIFTNLARLTSAIVLIPWMGITGAVISVLIYRLSTSLVVEYYLRKNHRVI